MNTHRQRGIVLITSVTVVMLLTSLGAALLMRSLNENLVGQRSATRQDAFYLAEAGLDQASINLRTPPPAENPQWIVADDIVTQTLPTGRFDLDPPQPMGVNIWQVTSHGISGSEQRDIQAVYQLIPQSVFQFAVFGDLNVTVSGNAETDSYDSRIGVYNDEPGPGYNKDHNGDIGTNSTAEGGIDFGGSIFVDGQLVVGPGVADPTSVVEDYDPSFITADPKVISATDTFPLPPVSVPPGLPCEDRSLVNDEVVTLTPDGGPLGNGTYCFHDLKLAGGSTFSSSGPVKVYITGTLTAKGNSATVGTSGAPKDMLILMTPESNAVIEDAALAGTTDFYGAIYGPGADINIFGNAEIFGSVVARSVNVTGSALIHYDEGLNDLTTITNIYQRRVVSWQELE